MSVKKYSLNFFKLSNYASFLVSNARDEMSNYVMGVSEELEEECHAAMFHDNMDIFRLMVHAQQFEVSHLRKSNREVNEAKHFKDSSSKSRLDVKTSLSLGRCFQTNFLLISPIITMIEILVLTLKRREMLIH